jgi:hypothetical protein
MHHIKSGNGNKKGQQADSLTLLPHQVRLTEQIHLYGVAISVIRITKQARINGPFKGDIWDMSQLSFPQDLDNLKTDPLWIVAFPVCEIE